MGAQWKAKGKALVADAKGKLFTKLVKEITVAARSGADPSQNARLRLVVEQARKVSMPKDTLERAIKKGAGLTGEAIHYETVLYEGFAPHQVAVMVQCLTDNVKRTAPEMRVLFRKGQLGTSGSVAWDFDHVGMIEAAPSQPDADLLDLLCHVAFNAPLLTRRQRAENLRRDKPDFFDQFGDEARQILNELLDRYTENGTDQLRLPDALRIAPISDHGNAMEIAAKFGGADSLRHAVAKLQTELYTT